MSNSKETTITTESPDIDYVCNPRPRKMKPSIDFLLSYCEERTRLLLRLRDIEEVLKNNRQTLMDHYMETAPEGRMKDVIIRLENDCGLNASED